MNHGNERSGKSSPLDDDENGSAISSSGIQERLDNINWLNSAGEAALTARRLAGAYRRSLNDREAFTLGVQQVTIDGAKMGMPRSLIMKAFGFPAIRLERWLAMGAAGNPGYDEWALKFQQAELYALLGADALAVSAAISDSKAAGILQKRVDKLAGLHERQGEGFLASLPVDMFTDEEREKFIASDGRDVPSWVLDGSTQIVESQRLRQAHAQALEESRLLRAQVANLSQELLLARNELLALAPAEPATIDGILEEFE